MAGRVPSPHAGGLAGQFHLLLDESGQVTNVGLFNEAQDLLVGKAMVTFDHKFGQKGQPDFHRTGKEWESLVNTGCFHHMLRAWNFHG